MAAGKYPFADGSGWPSSMSWLIRPERPAAGFMSPALWAIRQMQVRAGLAHLHLPSVATCNTYGPSLGAIVWRRSCRGRPAASLNT